MTPIDLDGALGEFRRSKDPAALSRAFDSAAPRLLLVAMHLSRDAADAEDLVQITFLEAIRSIERYDAARPALPWLLTILTRRASDLRRSRRGTETEPADTADSRAAPLEALAHEETLAKVARALETLPAPYHEVVALRFVHGLKIVDIARSLQRPVGTVHAQLHRGLKLLRSALPRSIAPLLVATLLGSERGLAAVRLEVLRSIAVPAKLAASTVGLVGLLVVALVLIATTQFAARHESPAISVPPVSPAHDPALAARGDTPSETKNPERVVAQHDVPAIRERKGRPEPAPDEERAIRIRGRCVAQEDGRPLSGVTIWFRQRWRSNHLTRMYESAGYELVEERLVTGSDGRFEFAASLVAQTSATLNMIPVDRVGRVAYWDDDSEEPWKRDLGDVELERGAVVRGRLVDERNAPFQGSVTIDLGDATRLGLGKDSNLSQTIIGFGSAADGVIDSRLASSAVPVGTWELRTRGAELLTPHTITVEPDTQVVEVLVRVRRPPTLAQWKGRLVDEDGHAIANVLVGGCQPGAPQPFSQTRTDSEGFFAFSTTRAGHVGLMEVRVGDPVDGYRALESSRVLAPGASASIVVATRPLAVTLEVVDAEDGAAVQDFGVWVSYPPAKEAVLMQGGRHAGGRVTLPVASEPIRLIVLPKRRDLRIKAVETVITPLQPTLRIQLACGTPLDVRVLAGGRAIEGAELAVLCDPDPSPAPPWRARYADPRTYFGEGFGAIGRGRIDDTSQTDHTGRARVHVRGEIPAQFLLVRSPNHPGRRVAISASDLARGTLDIALDDGGAISGRVTDPALAQEAALGVGAKREDDGRSFVDEDFPHVARIEPDGSFLLEGCAAGRWRLGFVMKKRLELIEPPVVVELSAGRVVEVLLDPSAGQPARLELEVSRNGGHLRGPGAWLSLYRIFPAESFHDFRQETPVRIDGERLTAFRFEGLTPGTWGVVLQWNEGGVHRVAFAPQPITLLPGAQVSDRIELTQRRLTVVLRDATGTLVPPLDWYFFGGFDASSSDRAHSCEVAPGYPVRLRHRNRQVDLPPLDLDPGRTEQTIEVRLPR